MHFENGNIDGLIARAKKERIAHFKAIKNTGRDLEVEFCHKEGNKASSHSIRFADDDARQAGFESLKTKLIPLDAGGKDLTKLGDEDKTKIEEYKKYLLELKDTGYTRFRGDFTPKRMSPSSYGYTITFYPESENSKKENSIGENSAEQMHRPSDSQQKTEETKDEEKAGNIKASFIKPFLFKTEEHGKNLEEFIRSNFAEQEKRITPKNDPHLTLQDVVDKGFTEHGNTLTPTESTDKTWSFLGKFYKYDEKDKGKLLETTHRLFTFDTEAAAKAFADNVRSRFPKRKRQANETKITLSGPPVSLESDEKDLSPDL